MIPPADFFQLRSCVVSDRTFRSSLSTLPALLNSPALAPGAAGPAFAAGQGLCLGTTALLQNLGGIRSTGKVAIGFTGLAAHVLQGAAAPGPAGAAAGGPRTLGGQDARQYGNWNKVPWSGGPSSVFSSQAHGPLSTRLWLRHQLSGATGPNRGALVAGQGAIRTCFAPTEAATPA